MTGICLLGAEIGVNEFVVLESKACVLNRGVLIEEQSTCCCDIFFNERGT